MCIGGGASWQWGKLETTPTTWLMEGGKDGVWVGEWKMRPQTLFEPHLTWHSQKQELGPLQSAKDSQYP